MASRPSSAGVDGSSLRFRPLQPVQLAPGTMSNKVDNMGLRHQNTDPVLGEAKHKRSAQLIRAWQLPWLVDETLGAAACSPAHLRCMLLLLDAAALLPWAPLQLPPPAPPLLSAYQATCWHSVQAPALRFERASATAVAAAQCPHAVRHQHLG